MPPVCGFGGSNGSVQQRHRLEGPAQEFARTGRALPRKVVVIGDGACGKTCLLNVFVNRKFPEGYEPTVFENHVTDLTVNHVPVELALWDTAGQEDFDRLRSLSYADTHVICICFSVDQPSSLDNVLHKWYPEVQELCKGVKICLVALKCDLREDERTIYFLARDGKQTVSYEEGLDMAKKIHASRYLECSAIMNRGVTEVFQQAAVVAVHARRKGETKGSGPIVDMRDDEAEMTSCTIS